MNAEQSAAELFADDLMRIVGSRLEMRLTGCHSTMMQLDLCDRQTGMSFATSAIHLSVTRGIVVSSDGKATSVVTDVSFRYG